VRKEGEGIAGGADVYEAVASVWEDLEGFTERAKIIGKRLLMGGGPHKVMNILDRVRAGGERRPERTASRTNAFIL